MTFDLAILPIMKLYPLYKIKVMQWKEITSYPIPPPSPTTHIELCIY